MNSPEEKAKGRPIKPIMFVVDDNGCHICTSHCLSGHSSKSPAGYPTIQIRKRKWRMNRYIYFSIYGEIPEGLVVRHTCDNSKCINPNHLILGTIGDNNKDKAERGRNRDQRGGRNNMSKLTDADVVDIKNSTLTTKQLSDKYKVSKVQIWYIKSGKRWSHIG